MHVSEMTECTQWLASAMAVEAQPADANDDALMPEAGMRKIVNSVAPLLTA